MALVAEVNAAGALASLPATTLAFGPALADALGLDVEDPGRLGLLAQSLYVGLLTHGAFDGDADDSTFAEAYRLLLFATTELEQPLWRIARNTFVYSEEQRVSADVPIASREFTEMAAVLDGHMRGRQFLVGERAGVADFVMAYTLDWGNEEKLLGGFPCLLEYMERMYDRPHAAPRIAAAFASLQA